MYNYGKDVLFSFCMTWFLKLKCAQESFEMFAKNASFLILLNSDLIISEWANYLFYNPAPCMITSLRWSEIQRLGSLSFSPRTSPSPYLEYFCIANFFFQLLFYMSIPSWSHFHPTYAYLVGNSSMVPYFFLHNFIFQLPPIFVHLKTTETEDQEWIGCPLQSQLRRQ